MQVLLLISQMKICRILKDKVLQKILLVKIEERRDINYRAQSD